MAMQHPQLSRLQIPQPNASLPPSLFTGLPSALHGSNFPLVTPINTSFSSQIPPVAPPRPSLHRSHPSLMFPTPATALAATFNSAGILNGTSLPGFTKASKRTASISIGGPPKAPLGGPNRKIAPPATPTPAAAQTEKAKTKKITVKLPVEGDPSGDDDAALPLWTRRPLRNFIVSEEPVIPADIQTIEPYLIDEILPNSMPEAIEVYLPAKSAWDEYYQKLVDQRLEKLGVENASSASSHQHARATSISSPADPALLMFKLNKLQQSRANSASVSPQPPPSVISMASTNSSLPPRFQQGAISRHGHSFSLANYNPSQLYAPVTMFNPLATSPGVNMGQSGALLGHDIPPRLHAPQGVTPLSINMPSATPSVSSAGPSRTASTNPDFHRGFGIDIPEEDEEALRSFGQYEISSFPNQLSEDFDDENRDQLHELKAVEEVDENEDDNTTAGVHTRHASKTSISVPAVPVSIEVHETIEENVPPELEQPVHWDLSGRAITPIPYPEDKGTQEMVAEWTGSEAEEATMDEYSNPSDEERARQARAERKAARMRQSIGSEIPRRLPEFPLPPENTSGMAHPSTDEDIVSNPSEEARNLEQSGWFHPQQHTHQPYPHDYSYYQNGTDAQARSPRPLPPLPHSRADSGHVSQPSSLHHSRHPSNVVEYESLAAPAVNKRDSLNPFAKPFVFGGGSFSLTAENRPPADITHGRQPSIGRPLNVAAAEFKPGFTFVPPAGVPKISFPSPEPARPLPAPPVGLSPSRVQGREKRRRRDSSASESMPADEETSDQDTMHSFRFPLLPLLPLRMSSPLHLGSERAISPLPQRSDAGLGPYNLKASSELSLLLPSSHRFTDNQIPPIGSGHVSHQSEGDISYKPHENEDPSQVEDTEEQETNAPRAQPATLPRKRPPVLEFRHPISTNTVPAALFKKALAATELDGPIRSAVRSRLSSREIFEHMNSPSLDDNDVPAIARMASRSHATEPHRHDAKPIVDIFTPAIPTEILGCDDRNHVSVKDTMSSISETKLTDFSQGEHSNQLEQRLEDMLDDRMELAKKDLVETHKQATDQLVFKVLDAMKVHVSEIIERSQEGTADAKGEIDFDFIRTMLEDSVMDIRTGLRRDLEELLRTAEPVPSLDRTLASLPPDFRQILEEFGSRTVSAVTNAVVKFANRIDQIDELARIRASDERESLLSDIYTILAPHLDTLQHPPVDFDAVTAKLAEAVKPHISQLIDLTSDKKETAGLILQRLMPTLNSLVDRPPQVDTDALVAHLRVELAQMVPASDPHVLKEAVADLVVERLDSRLAVREKTYSSETLYSRISERIDDLHAPVSDVRKAVENLHNGQDYLRERSDVLNKLYQDMAAQLLELPKSVESVVNDVKASVQQLQVDAGSGLSKLDALDQITTVLESANSNIAQVSQTAHGLVSRSSILAESQEKILSSISNLPREINDAIASIKQAQAEFMAAQSSSPDHSAEIRNLQASNAELQVQLAKARGAHGQIRVEKDLMHERMTIAESECSAFRNEVEDLKNKISAKETEIALSGLRVTSLEDALSHATARLEVSESTGKVKDERITELERQNRQYSLDQHQYKSQVQKLELQEEWLKRDKENLEMRNSQLEQELKQLTSEQSHWEEVRRTSERVEQLVQAFNNAESKELMELRAVSDKAKILEGEHLALQKRFKEAESRIVNMERAAQSAKQNVAMAQDHATELEQRNKDLESELDATRARLEETEDIRMQLDSDLALVKLQLEEREKAERAAKEKEVEMQSEISSLQAQLANLRNELGNPTRTPQSLSIVSTPHWVATNGHSHVRPSSRTSTAYGGSPVTPTDMSFRKTQFAPSRAPSVVPETPTKKGVWESMHAPRPTLHPIRPTPRTSYPSRAAMPSPTPSTISRQEDGWYTR